MAGVKQNKLERGNKNAIVAQSDKPQKGPNKFVQQRFINLELRALALVLLNWSRVDKDKPNKVRAFRNAMMTDLNKGAKEFIPHEIVEDEYCVMLEMLQGLSLADYGTWIDTILMDGKKKIPITRALPCPKEQDDMFYNSLSSKRKLERVARLFVVTRLRVSESTVKNALKKTSERRYKTTVRQRFLVSLCWDVSSQHNSQNRLAMQCLILDALNKTHYDHRGIYYIVQTIHALSTATAIENYSYTQVERICKMLVPRLSTDGWFSELAD